MRHLDPIPELKRRLAGELVRVIREDRWTTTELVFRIRIDQPRVSELRRGRLERISVERLIRWLAQIGQRVDVTVTKERGTRVERLALTVSGKQETKGGRGPER